MLEKYSVDNGVNIATVYLERNLLEHLTYKEANALLIKSVPKDRKDVIMIIINAWEKDAPNEKWHFLVQLLEKSISKKSQVLFCIFSSF